MEPLKSKATAQAIAVMRISREDGYCGPRGLGWKEVWVLVAFEGLATIPIHPAMSPGRPVLCIKGYLG